jgi:hypothetical protein
MRYFHGFSEYKSGKLDMGKRFGKKQLIYLKCPGLIAIKPKGFNLIQKPWENDHFLIFFGVICLSPFSLCG